MRFSPSPHDRPQCPICRAAVAADSSFCAACGARIVEAHAEELRSVIYLLSELDRWEASGIITSEQAAALRGRYEHRREALRAEMSSDVKAKTSAPAPTETQAPGINAQSSEAATGTPVRPAPSQIRHAATMTKPARASSQESRRSLIETLTDPHTLRLLLYTGAAMFVVGVIIWLRDVLYLKLQEPVVQAALLALGTLVLTASGWLTILRTRQRLTGRALTLIGSLLVPVNFWFLVRSGLIANRGRTWMVCAFCALLYAHTAALLREKLYAYLACLASIATAWALIHRAEPEAFGLYALTLMGLSLLFLHLSRLVPLARDASIETGHTPDEFRSANGRGAERSERWDYALWGAPLVRSGLAGATLCVLLYMSLRLWSSPPPDGGMFRLRAHGYDSGVAMLLFAAGAYVAWFTGRYIYTDRRILLYTLCALALFWMEFLAADGLRLSGSTTLSMIALSALITAIAARLIQGDALPEALHRASALASVALAPAAFGVLLFASEATLRHSAAFAALAAGFAALSAPRFSGRAAQAALAYASAIFASVAFLIALDRVPLRSETLFVTACALFPFALYALAELLKKHQSGTQLATPFARVADLEFILLTLWASTIALLLSLGDEVLNAWRPSMFCALLAAILYGALRGVRERSAFGAGLASVAALILVAATVDALKDWGLWPSAWPIAAAVVCAAFLIRRVGPYWLGLERESVSADDFSPEAIINSIMDGAVIICALLWFATVLYSIFDGGFGAAGVLLLALLYWGERTARGRLAALAYVTAVHACALLLALLIALQVSPRWFAAISVSVLFPFFFTLGRLARARGDDWVAGPASVAAGLLAALASVSALLQALPHLDAGDPLLLAPCLTIGVVAVLSFGASLLSTEQVRVRYFRAGLYAAVMSFALACLRAGYQPLNDLEMYTSPVGVLLLIVAYLSVRHEWDDYARDTNLLLWAGSILLCGPLLIRALQFRLLLDVPAPWRDLGALCASLAIILFGALGRLRAPVLVGGVALVTELTALALTSVDWLQVPLKIYLVTVGALIVLIAWMLEFRREQLLFMRERFNAHREYARERFGEWR
ncbi:MAG TPA: hypothetical protein VD966_03675 [Pyrinomonadaceae bacterium]|nr:hypothetical protein [Pyrinomonadaceae bacterium]